MPQEKAGIIAELWEWIKGYAPFISTFFLSSWGGAVSHFQALRKSGAKFNWREFAFDITTSSFAGLLTYYGCQAAGVAGDSAAILIAISGHMGARAIATFTYFHEKVFTKEGAK